MRLRDPQTIIEQIALLFASLVWTIIVLVAITFFWAYQDVQTRWEFVLNAPSEALAQSVVEINATPTATPFPSPTPWTGPGATLTPSPTSPPTPTPTRVVSLPEILPETLNPDEATPISVIVHTEDEAEEFGLTQESNAGPVTVRIQPTPTPETNVSAELPTDTEVSADPTAAVLVAQPTVAPESAAEIAASEVPIPSDLLPTRLIIPSIDIDSEIIPVGWTVVKRNGTEYSIWKVADYAVGWHQTTASLGQPGNTVMAGHHNVNGEIFRDLVNVEVGDTVVAYAGGQKFEYIVELKTIVKEKGESVEVRRRNAQWIAPTDDERLTFVTCWPYTNNTHRVIVVAKPAT